MSEAHPVADFYQWMTEDEIDALAASIRESGLEKPIHRLPDGRIIDGRNRELACLVAGIKPRYKSRSLATEAEIIAHIRAANEYRRHGSESQRAMSPELKQFVEDELRLEGKRKVLRSKSPKRVAPPDYDEL